MPEKLVAVVERAKLVWRRNHRSWRAFTLVWRGIAHALFGMNRAEDGRDGCHGGRVDGLNLEPLAGT